MYNARKNKHFKFFAFQKTLQLHASSITEYLHTSYIRHIFLKSTKRKGIDIKSIIL